MPYNLISDQHQRDLQEVINTRPRSNIDVSVPTSQLPISVRRDRTSNYWGMQKLTDRLKKTFTKPKPEPLPELFDATGNSYMVTRRPDGYHIYTLYHGPNEKYLESNKARSHLAPTEFVIAVHDNPVITCNPTTGEIMIIFGNIVMCTITVDEANETFTTNYSNEFPGLDKTRFESQLMQLLESVL